MPMYEYLCEACGEKQDVYHKMAETPDVMCKCGTKMIRTISCPASVGSVSGGPALCKECRLKDRKDGTYKQGGCDKGKKCRGFSPFNASMARKKIPYKQMLRRTK